MINVFSKTDVGRVRKVNQDAVKTEVISDNLAWSVVCDGMGGQAGGDIASEIAVIMISKFSFIQVLLSILIKSLNKYHLLL